VEIAPADFFESVPTADIHVLSDVVDWNNASALRILKSPMIEVMADGDARERDRLGRASNCESE
jgi:hypothetical protein